MNSEENEGMLRYAVVLLEKFTLSLKLRKISVNIFFVF